MAKSKLIKANKKIAETVVNGYKGIENRVVGTYTKIEDKFVDQYLTHEGESVEDERHKAEAEARAAGKKMRAEAKI